MPPRARSMPQPPPAVSPDQMNDTFLRCAGAVRKRPTCGSPTIAGDDEVLETDAIEDVLPRRQVFEQQLAGEVALRQHVDIGGVADLPEAFGGGDLDQHARRPVGARPHHAGIDRDVARLQAMGDARTIRREAEIGSCDTVDRGRRGRRTGRRQERCGATSRAGRHANRHWASSSRFATDDARAA